MTLDKFLKKLISQPELIEFTETMSVIESDYNFTEVAFSNGKQRNAAGENSGSCKLFSFAKLNGLTKDQTLACFGAYYREDVLGSPDGDDHQNIRQFMINGWSGINFSATALSVK
jgi:hypothetical protein